MLDKQTARYIAVTARDMSRRWDEELPPDVRTLRSDLAWLARQVAKLAEAATDA